MKIMLPVGAGFVIGFLIGLTGMGGGALMTPFLLIAMKLEPATAIGTDLAFAAITKIVGGTQHYRHGNVALKQVAWMALGSLPASFASAQLVLRLDPRMVKNVLPSILGSVLVLVGLTIMAQALELLHPRQAAVPLWPHPVVLVLIGTVGGILVGVTSIGGGTVIMAMLMVFFSIPVVYLVGLDVLHGALLANTAALTYALAGRTEWPLVGLLLLGSIPGVWLGVYSISRVDRRIIRGVLAVLIIGAGINLLLN